jgi:hypothetical protein
VRADWVRGEDLFEGEGVKLLTGAGLLKQTQSHLTPYGNCWQTAIACVLGVTAESLPDQHVIELATATENAENFAGHHSYSNALNAYLTKHHGLGYVQDPAWRIAPFELRDPGLHVLIGPTVRTKADGDGPRILHCVVARHGKAIWDPHPSRTGLTSIKSWGWLIDVTGTAGAHPGEGWHFLSEAAVKRDRLSWDNRADKAPSVSTLCCCPACFVDGDYLP